MKQLSIVIPTFNRKNYYGLNSSFSKFKKFVSEFEFISVKQAADTISWDKSPVISVSFK